MKNNRIAVFANGWSNEFIRLILEGIRKSAKEDGVDVFMFLSYIYFAESEEQCLSKLSAIAHADPSMFDGAIILTNTFNTPIEQNVILDKFKDAGIPIISTEVKVPGLPYIGTGNYEGEYELANHLIDVHGVKKVVYMRGIQGNEECAIRKRALEDALAAHGLELVDTLQGDFSFFTATQEIQRWATAGKPWPDAFVCANDLMALGVSSELHRMGVDIPEDVIVTGFDSISEGVSTFPIISTVSRRWDLLGEYAYEQLKDQIKHPNPSYEKVYPSEFVPSESCGCPARPEQIAKRLETVRSSYLVNNYTNMMDIYFQNLRLYLLKAETEDDFFEAAKKDDGFDFFLGKDCYICVEPDFFTSEEETYVKTREDYSPTLHAIYAKKDGRYIKPFDFDSKYFVPEYTHEKDSSNLYIITPLGTGESTIGYLVLENSTSMLYDMSLRKWVTNMETLFSTVRQYIFSQSVNRKLTEVYMTDFLTGMYNRTGCENVLFRFIESEKAAGRNTILLFADIDYMKKINDRYGHLNGDMAIKATADAMKRSLPGDWIFGRYGGDEFVAVGSCPEGLAIEMKDQLDASIKQYIESFKLRFELSVSVGYRVITPNDDGTIDDYISSADESMYDAKEIAHKRIEERTAKNR